MPNLVGIGNSQVPTNAMLGGLAYQDPAHANLTNVEIENISKIKSIIPAEPSRNTGDVFVYDTRKDSDGGAWRKRTSHTSWYNEPSSHQRGPRKEFPAVAILVVRSQVNTETMLSIYDGDDPNMPLWMEFVSDASTPYNILPHASAIINSVYALNGQIALGYATNYGLGIIDFISEWTVCAWRENSKQIYRGNIAQRNDGLGATNEADDNSSHGLVQWIGHYIVNDVVMTVLPNEPINPKTGLPNPTIAAAHATGVTIVRGNHTTINRATTSAHVSHVQFMKSNEGRVKLAMTAPLYYAVYPNAFVQLSESYAGNYGNTSAYYAYRYGNSWANAPAPMDYVDDIVALDSRTIASATDSGFNIHQLSREEWIMDDNHGMMAYIAKDYNTGWQVGDTSITALASTDETDLNEGSNVVTSSSFDSASGWTVGNWTVTGGQAVGSNGDGYIMQACLTVGQDYRVTLDVAAVSGNVYVYTGAGAPGNGNHYHSASSTGYHSWVMRAWGGNLGLYLPSGSSATINAIHVAVADKNRAQPNFGSSPRLSRLKGLRIHGTIPRQPVATGAELVSYGPFSSANYLWQDVVSEMNFDTGDMHVMFWFNMTSKATQCFFHRGDGASGTWGSGPIIQIESVSGTGFRGFLAASGFSSYDVVDIDWSYIQTDVWHHYALVRRGQRVYAYLDGIAITSTKSTRGLNNNSANVWIGERPNSSRPASASQMALLRTGAHGPSDEQLKKIYDDERKLFAPNAKCTLYGSSNDITAIAHDTTTDVLHVGTSSGRSDFVGLNRINNTTTAVTTAISASGGLIAEK